MENNSSWQQAQPILQILSSLSYQAGELNGYLYEIVNSVSQLFELDWSAITLCSDGKERIMASSLALDETERIMTSSLVFDEGEPIYSLHGTLTSIVIQTGKTICVEDAKNYKEYGNPPEGYESYLGVPLRIYGGEVIGTICSFCKKPRLFTLEEVQTVELFAERAATAIDNYHLYQKQKKFNEFLEIEIARRTEELRIAQKKLVEQERLAAIGEFASMIVHEIRNPVTTILMGLNYFKRTYHSFKDQERVTLALEEANRLQNLLKEILLYAKPQILKLENLEINKFVQEMLMYLHEMPEAQKRKLKFISASKDVHIQIDKDKFKQVLIHLVRNACEAIEPGDEVTCKIESIIDSNQVYMSIHNGGHPIPAEILPKLTQPFCSTKPEGTGLGLAIVQRIIDAHRGSLSIESNQLIGTIVKIGIPLSSSPILSSKF